MQNEILAAIRDAHCCRAVCQPAAAYARQRDEQVKQL